MLLKHTRNVTLLAAGLLVLLVAGAALAAPRTASAMRGPMFTSTTTLTASLPSTFYGQQAMFTAQVWGPVGITDGFVRFNVDAELPVWMPLQNGRATLTRSDLAVGSHTIRASYDGDSWHTASRAELSHPVIMAPSVVTLSSSANPSVYGQLTTLTTLVFAQSRGAGAPTGSVSWRVGTAVLASAPLANGRASVTLTPPPGRTVIEAVYEGDTGFASDVSMPLTQVVDQAVTTVTLDATPGATVPGQAVHVAYNVQVAAPGTGNPIGTVTVSDGAGNHCSGSVAGGSCSITFTTEGTFRLTATYVGDGNYSGSTSPAVSHHVSGVSEIAPSPSMPSPTPSSTPELSQPAAPATPQPPSARLLIPMVVSGRP